MVSGQDGALHGFRLLTAPASVLSVLGELAVVHQPEGLDSESTTAVQNHQVEVLISPEDLGLPGSLVSRAAPPLG